MRLSTLMRTVARSPGRRAAGLAGPVPPAGNVLALVYMPAPFRDPILTMMRAAKTSFAHNFTEDFYEPDTERQAALHATLPQWRSRS
jgi:hypothetical protein